MWSFSLSFESVLDFSKIDGPAMSKMVEPANNRLHVMSERERDVCPPQRKTIINENG